MKFIDIYISSAAFILGLVLCALCFPVIQADLKPKPSVLEEYMVLGVRHYNITSNGTCIGHLSSHLLTQQALSMKLLGAFSVQIGSQPLDLNLEAKAHFNPLGQLADSDIKLSSKYSSVSITTESINPIKASLTLRNDNNTKSFTRNIPGPISVREVGAEKYRLEYANNTALSNLSTLDPILETALFRSIELKEINSKIERCSPKERGTLDLSPITDLLGSMAKRYQKFSSIFGSKL